MVQCYLVQGILRTSETLQRFKAVSEKYSGDKMSVCVFVCMYVCVCVRVRVHVCACVHACVCVFQHRSIV